MEGSAPDRRDRAAEVRKEEEKKERERQRILKEETARDAPAPSSAFEQHVLQSTTAISRPTPISLSLSRKHAHAKGCSVGNHACAMWTFAWSLRFNTLAVVTILQCLHIEPYHVERLPFRRSRRLGSRWRRRSRPSAKSPRGATGASWGCLFNFSSQRATRAAVSGGLPRRLRTPSVAANPGGKSRQPDIRARLQAEIESVNKELAESYTKRRA